MLCNSHLLEYASLGEKKKNCQVVFFPLISIKLAFGKVRKKCFPIKSPGNKKKYISNFTSIMTQNSLKKSFWKVIFSLSFFLLNFSPKLEWRDLSIMERWEKVRSRYTVFFSAVVVIPGLVITVTIETLPCYCYRLNSRSRVQKISKSLF